ncbi:MAG: TIGR00282 family metallophosphoesterase [Thermoanaerobaculia bacterium]|nr:TIGR00282 family metallophosphoesterase [Thermoanaerobaculia bacterium]
MVRILYIGDVVGKPGRRVLKEKLPGVVDRENVDFTIVNIENSAGGFGVTGPIVEELDALDIDVYTTGNHVWDKKDFVASMDEYDHLVRPANYPEGNPGRGMVVGETPGGVPVAVIQLMGQVFMPPCGNPFHKANELLDSLEPEVRVIFVDIHCEATSEKQAMGRHLNGRASIVVGTHTHVPTADDRILSGGTAFQTDVGMTGAYDGIIGFREDEILHRFLMNTPSRMEVASRDVRMLGLLVDVDEKTGKAESVKRVEERLED